MRYLSHVFLIFALLSFLKIMYSIQHCRVLQCNGLRDWWVRNTSQNEKKVPCFSKGISFVLFTSLRPVLNMQKKCSGQRELRWQLLFWEPILRSSVLYWPLARTPGVFFPSKMFADLKYDPGSMVTTTGITFLKKTGLELWILAKIYVILRTVSKVNTCYCTVLFR